MCRVLDNAFQTVSSICLLVSIDLSMKLLYVKHQLEWFVQARPCKPHIFSTIEAHELLSCRKIAFVGDSLSRHLAGTLAEFLWDGNMTLPDLGPAMHKDFDLPATCRAKLRFLWRPQACYCRCINLDLY
jgi:hypothetical protein